MINLFRSKLFKRSTYVKPIEISDGTFEIRQYRVLKVLLQPTEMNIHGGNTHTIFVGNVPDSGYQHDKFEEAKRLEFLQVQATLPSRRDRSSLELINNGYSDFQKDSPYQPVYFATPVQITIP